MATTIVNNFINKSASVRTDGLLIHYDFNDPDSYNNTGFLNDLSGNDNHVAYTATPATVDGVVTHNATFRFGGLQSIQLPVTPTGLFGSFEFVIKVAPWDSYPNNLGYAQGYLYHEGNPGSFNSCPVVRSRASLSSLNAILFRYPSAIQYISFVSPDAFFIDNEWAHIVITYGGGQVRFYKNGIIVNSFTTGTTPFVGTHDYAGLMRAHATTGWTNTSPFMNMGVFRKYNIALNGRDVVRNYLNAKQTYTMLP